MAEPWMKWAMAEGGTKTLSRLLNKYVGIASGTFAGSLAAYAVVSAIQMLGGLAGTTIRGRSIFISPPQLLGAALFGITASIMSVLAVFSFTYEGADVGITTFIVTMSIIPGALIDWVFFKHPLSPRQWLGIAVFIAAGYAVLNFPEIRTLLVLPPWVWLTFGIALLGAVNEGITQWQAQRKIDPLDPLVNNFWIGLTSVLTSGGALVVFGGLHSISQLPGRFWLGSAAIGFIVIGMISFKLLAYKGGGSIALKKLIMQAAYLISATFTGWLFYAEPLTVGKLVGMAGYLVAFTLMDKGTWELARRFGQKRRFSSA